MINLFPSDFIHRCRSWPTSLSKADPVKPAALTDLLMRMSTKIGGWNPRAGFDRIVGLNKIGRVIAPAIIAPGEEGRSHGIGILPVLTSSWPLLLIDRHPGL